MKPTHEEITTAVGELGVLKYFPSDPFSQKGVMKLLDRMVATTEQLDWLVRTMVDRVGTWEGPVELRGVFCTRYRAADGIEAYSSLPGFRGEDSEMAQAYLPPVTLRELGAPGMKLLAAPEETAAIEAALEMPVDKAEAAAFKRLPKPNAADRRYSRALLGHLS